MKNLSIYKIYLKAHKTLDTFPKKIKYFHRTKWKFINKKANKYTRFQIHTQRYRYKFKNFFSYKSIKSKKIFIRMKKYSTESVRNKNGFLQLFDNSFNSSILKKDFLKLNSLDFSNILKLVLTKQIFFINVFLWKLHFFATSQDACSYINENYVLVNGKRVLSNYFLKEGDIIEFKDLYFILKIKTNLNRYKAMFKIYSFVEIDYYSCTLVVVKNYNEFIQDDLSLIFPKTISISSIYNTFK